VRDASDAIQAAINDGVVARHYADVDLAGMRPEVLKKDRVAYVSYRKGEQIYWTTRPVVIPSGETILSNGTEAIRARCGNLISAVPLIPTSETEITELDLVDIPEPVAITTNAPVSVRPLPMDELFALARLLPDTDATLLVPAAEPTSLGPEMLYGGGPGLLRGYGGVITDTPGSQTESTPAQTPEPVPTPGTILPPPDTLLTGPQIPGVNKSPEPLPDVTVIDVQPGAGPNDKTPPGPPVSVPEPATWVLLGTGVVLTFLRRRRS
jgi:hypothetical protein